MYDTMNICSSLSFSFIGLGLPLAISKLLCPVVLRQVAGKGSSRGLGKSTKYLVLLKNSQYGAGKTVSLD
jgi:hypothetical protein